MSLNEAHESDTRAKRTAGTKHDIKFIVSDTKCGRTPVAAKKNILVCRKLTQIFSVII